MIEVSVSYTHSDADGSAEVVVNLETDAGYNPDALEDMSTRLPRLLRDALAEVWPSEA